MEVVFSKNYLFKLLLMYTKYQTKLTALYISAYKDKMDEIIIFLL